MKIYRILGGMLLIINFSLFAMGEKLIQERKPVQADWKTELNKEELMEIIKRINKEESEKKLKKLIKKLSFDEIFYTEEAVGHEWITADKIKNIRIRKSVFLDGINNDFALKLIVLKTYEELSGSGLEEALFLLLCAEILSTKGNDIIIIIIELGLFDILLRSLFLLKKHGILKKDGLIKSFKRTTLMDEIEWIYKNSPLEESLFELYAYLFPKSPENKLRKVLNKSNVKIDTDGCAYCLDNIQKAVDWTCNISKKEMYKIREEHIEYYVHRLSID